MKTVALMFTVSTAIAAVAATTVARSTTSPPGKFQGTDALFAQRDAPMAKSFNIPGYDFWKSKTTLQLDPTPQCRGGS